MLVSSIPVLITCSCFSFSLVYNIPLYELPQFSYPSHCWWALELFLLLTVTDSALSGPARVRRWKCAHLSAGYIGVGLLGVRVFSISRYCPAVFQHGCTSSPPSCARSLPSPTLSVFSILALLVGINNSHFSGG